MKTKLVSSQKRYQVGYAALGRYRSEEAEGVPVPEKVAHIQSYLENQVVFQQGSWLPQGALRPVDRLCLREILFEIGVSGIQMWYVSRGLETFNERCHIQACYEQFGLPL